MDLHLVLCAFVLFYGLLSRSMFLRLFLWPVISFYLSSFSFLTFYLVLCFFFFFYRRLSSYIPVFGFFVFCVVCFSIFLFSVPSFRSMARYLVLCSFVLFYGPSSRSLCLRPVLWTLILFYAPSVVYISWSIYLYLCS